MKWQDVGDKIKKFAPILGGLVTGGPVGAGIAAINMVASSLGVEATEDAVSKALDSDPDAAVKIAKIESDERVALSRLALENETARLAEVNATIRAEVASKDKYTSRARPTFVYVLAFSVLLEVLLAFFVTILVSIQGDKSPVTFFDLKLLYEAMVVPQSVAMAAIGIYFKKRSDEKGMGVGIAPSGGLLGALGIK